MSWKFYGILSGAIGLLAMATVVMGQGGGNVAQAPGNVTVGHLTTWYGQGLIGDGGIPNGASIYDYATPVTTNTVTAAANSFGCSINPAGTIAALTIKLPPSPVDGQIYTCGFSQAVTAVTWQDSGGTAGNVVGAPAGAAIGTHVEFVYHGADTKWHPI